MEHHFGIGHEGQFIRGENAHIEEQEKDQNVPENVEFGVVVDHILLLLYLHFLR
jgi:hypothetical protein